MTEKEQVDAFLEEYKALCRKHMVIVLSEGEMVEAVAVTDVNRFWDIEWSTNYRRAQRDNP